MVKRKSLDGSSCPVARSLDAIGDWWSLLIVREAMSGTRRFSEFQKNLGMAKNILSTRLRTLVGHGILEQAPASDGSAYQEYLLTEKGRRLFPIIVALRQWGEEYLCEPAYLSDMLVDKLSGRPLSRLEIKAADGRVLDLSEVSLIRA